MYLFGNVKYVTPTTFARHLDNWINVANIKKISPHGFRHSHESLLIHLGVIEEMLLIDLATQLMLLNEPMLIYSPKREVLL